MSVVNDGGPAFPSQDSTYPNGEIVPGSFGMTLRDFFAAKAMPELIREFWGEHDATWEIAHGSYQLADAMLAERAKGGSL